jgi:hypothetical protein
MLAPKLARAVYPRLTRQVACAPETGCQRSGRGADEPAASLDPQGMTLSKALEQAACTASVHAKAPRRARGPAPCALIGPPLSLLGVAALVAHGLRVRLLTRAWCSRDNPYVLSPLFAEDGRRERINCSVAEPAPTLLCTRRFGVERTSLRVWGRHIRLRRDTESTSAHATVG